jgi:hypothetical protein
MSWSNCAKQPCRFLQRLPSIARPSRRFSSTTGHPLPPSPSHPFCPRPLVKYWADLLWKQLPAGPTLFFSSDLASSHRYSRSLSDLRLTALDEIENDLIVLREEKLMQFLWTKAAKHSALSIYRGVLKIWKRLCFNTALIKRQRRLVFERSSPNSLSLPALTGVPVQAEREILPLLAQLLGVQTPKTEAPRAGRSDGQLHSQGSLLRPHQALQLRLQQHRSRGGSLRQGTEGGGSGFCEDPLRLEEA